MYPAQQPSPVIIYQLKASVHLLENRGAELFSDYVIML